MAGISCFFGDCAFIPSRHDDFGLPWEQLALSPCLFWYQTSPWWYRMDHADPIRLGSARIAITVVAVGQTQFAG